MYSDDTKFYVQQSRLKREIEELKRRVEELEAENRRLVSLVRNLWDHNNILAGIAKEISNRKIELEMAMADKEFLERKLKEHKG